MNDNHSVLRNKRELTPKVNHTKTTITKSTPFLIRKHHLDDTDMKNALHYDEGYFKPSPVRRYSFKGQVITCQNSKLTTNIHTGHDHSNKIGASQIPQHDSVDYYGLNNHKQIKNGGVLPQIQIQKQAPYFPNSGQRQHRVKTTQSRQEKERSYIERNRQRDVQLQLGREYQEYGLREMHTARKKMEKEAKKLRELYKKKVEKDIKSINKGEVTQLEEQIKQLKIQNLEIQKQRQIYELNIKMHSQTDKKVKGESDKELLKYSKAKFLLAKPKYQPFLRGGDDTDSSFSSFQLY